MHFEINRQNFSQLRKEQITQSSEFSIRMESPNEYSSYKKKRITPPTTLNSKNSTRSLTDDPGREVLDSLPLFFPPLPGTGDATALRLPEVGLLAERGWDEVGGREPGNDNNLPINDHVFGAKIHAESDTRVKENN